MRQGYLEKIIDLATVQIQIVKTTDKAPCKDEFVGLMTAIKGWAEKQKKAGQNARL